MHLSLWIVILLARNASGHSPGLTGSPYRCLPFQSQCCDWTGPCGFYCDWKTPLAITPLKGQDFLLTDPGKHVACLGPHREAVDVGCGDGERERAGGGWGRGAEREPGVLLLLESRVGELVFHRFTLYW